jgi:hypothetical protein
MEDQIGSNMVKNLGKYYHCFVNDNGALEMVRMKRIRLSKLKKSRKKRSAD